MNNIDFEIVPYIVNNVTYGYMLELLIDGSPPTSSQFDPIEFVAATFNIRGAELFTCTCGVAGCAGVFEGVYIKFRGHTVEWRDCDDILSRRFYSFDKNAYKAAQVKCMRHMFDIINLNEEIRKEIYSNETTDDIEDILVYSGLEMYARTESELLEYVNRRQRYFKKYLTNIQ